MTPTEVELNAAWFAACKAWTLAHKSGWTTKTREKYKAAFAEYNRLKEAVLPIDKSPAEE